MATAKEAKALLSELQGEQRITPRLIKFLEECTASLPDNDLPKAATPADIQKAAERGFNGGPREEQPKGDV